MLPPTAGETKRMCIVCLEPYAEGEKIRVLPCHHRRADPALCILV